MAKKSPTGKERRKSPRRKVEDSFSLGAVLPKKGPHRLKIFDLSETGLGIEIDVESDDPFPLELKEGDSLECYLYVNQSLYVPLEGKIAWLRGPSPRRAGLDLDEKRSKGFVGYVSFLKALDSLAESGVMESAKG